MYNATSVIKPHNEKVNTDAQRISSCYYRKKYECLLDGKCRIENLMCKCVDSATGHLNKVYLGNAEDNFKNSYNNHKESFNNKFDA